MARYSDEIIDDVRQSNDIVDVISQYVRLKRSGRNYFGLCPFHNEKSPSFSVSPEKQIFHCFGCGVGGNVFTFLTKIEGINFVEAVQLLAERANIQLPTLENNMDSAKEALKAKVYKVNEFTANYYHENLYKPESKIAQEYVKKRKLSNETLKSFQIGFSGKFDELYRELKKQGFEDREILESGLVNKNERGQFIDRYRNRLMFPICDARGRVIAFGGRVLDDSKPKYINSPENVVYSKGRHLYGLNVAKKYDIKKRLLIVEGYMDVISLHQRDIHNVVASLGTALTQQQGYLLRNHTEQIILSYDSDEAGQTAKVRAMEILQNMGCDIRVLQMEGAKDPDEYVIKYGNARFQNLVDKAISVIEFKVKILRQSLNLENTNDKIKFLNEIAKILAKISNQMEREIYITKLSKEYQISQEAIQAEVNKLLFAGNTGSKKLEKKVVTMKPQIEEQNNSVSPAMLKRENMVIYLLINETEQCYEKLKNVIQVNDFKDNLNKQILKKLYEELEKGNINTSHILDWFEEENIINHITEIMAYDFEITELDKCIEDVINSYTKEKTIKRRNEIIKQLEDKNISREEAEGLEKELNDIIISLAKMK